MSLDSYVYATLPGEDALVFAFHGTGGDERQFLPLARSIWPLAEIVAPRGDVSEHGALRFFRRTGEGVYDFDDLARRTASMATFVSAHKARAGHARTLGIGCSNGANMLTSVALAEPGLFDDIALLHPLIPWRPRDDARLASLRSSSRGAGAIPSARRNKRSRSPISGRGKAPRRNSNGTKAATNWGQANLRRSNNGAAAAPTRRRPERRCAQEPERFASISASTRNSLSIPAEESLTKPV